MPGTFQDTQGPQPKGMCGGGALSGDTAEASAGPPPALGLDAAAGGRSARAGRPAVCKVHMTS